ncbi:MAG: LamG-like jellyroll fold domain-containing protein [Algibacter sp.]
MKSYKYYLILFFGLILSPNIIAQTLIKSQSFDATASGYADDLSYSVSSGSLVSLSTTSPLSSPNSMRFTGSGPSDIEFDDVDISTYTSVTVTVAFKAINVDNNEDLDFYLSYDGGSNYSLIEKLIDGSGSNENRDWGDVDSSSGAAASNPYTFSVSDVNTSVRLKIESTDLDTSDYFYIDNVLIEGTAISTAPEIDVTGLTYSIIGDGSNTPTLSDNTDFGTSQIVSETLTKTFVINNTGTGDLTLGTIALAGPSEFVIDSAPTSGTIIASGGTADVVVSFSTSTIASQTDILIIASDDTDEASYQINLAAEGDKVFFDSDGDGVYDDVDIDDDNDGIKDSDEENACRLSSGAGQADYKFLNETFGTGTGRSSAISTLYTASTSYCIEDGDSSITLPDECDTNTSVNDGEYTVASFITTGVNGESVGPTGDAIASWAWYAWAPIEDHTAGDIDGKMAIFNADINPGVFYETTITGTLTGVPITYSFWVINLDNADSEFSSGSLQSNGHRILPEVTVNFLTTDRSTTIATFNTGPITRCSGDTYIDTDHIGSGVHDPTYNICATSEWKQFAQQFTTSTETAFIVQFVNTAPGGGGNDLAIDDIEVRQTLCDMDHDSVADIFDLDSDDDGIPDAVEANPTAANLTEGKGHLTGVSSWDDSLNNNGMHDSLESISPVDTDGDGIPDYLDLDSDNDGIFDVDESGVINTNDTTFQNGDGDITGDGTGDGGETENFREQDSDGDGTIEGYGDGILDIYDFHEGNSTYTNSYGNTNQGTAPLYALDSDSDGIPDYKDPESNRNGNLYDIDNQEIYATLPNTLGILDSTTDADGDGIMASRDGDDTVFGSPRDLDDSYSLYFDGRNDYVEDTNVIASGDATLMTFVKKEGTNTSGDDQIVAGQDDLYIIINDATNLISAIVEGVTLTSTTTLTDGIWAHIAVTTTSDSGGETILYINGVQEDSDASGGITDASNLTIGRASTSNNYFKGEIDEVRVFNAALTSDEISRMVYQELDDANSFNRGKIIPQDISATIGFNLVKYYKMDGYQDDILDDKKSASIDVSGAKVYNIKDIYFQRAPLPYETSSNGDWTNSAIWLYGSEWDITSKQDNPNDASIVHIKNNITLNGSYDTQGTVGIIVDSAREFTIEGDKGLYNSWYLELHGQIDLEDESQLIQTDESILLSTSSGTLEKDQQGTADTFTYNYWSSPVGLTNSSTNNLSYKVTDVFSNVTFLTSGYDGIASPVSVADYWIWKYSNKASNTYALWQHVRSTGYLDIGEGFTMKGVTNTGGNIALTQNYIFNGKPNNGLITLPISANSDYLVGNPYPSAIDADEFILDNISDGLGRASSNIIDGTLYFWEHFASNTHYLSEYEGGYGMYSMMGGTAAFTSDVLINTSGSLTSVKDAPGQHIPVGQGFFVVAADPSPTNLITFKNSQRVFIKETASSSVFIKQSNSKVNNENTITDDRPKIKLMFNSPKGYQRQLLVGIDQNATDGVDIGYDAKLIEDNTEDLFWDLNNSQYIIQAVNNFDLDQVLPLGVKISQQGLATLKIDALEHIETTQNLFLHDKSLNVYHDLKQSDYEVYLTVGEHLNRFEITFMSPESLNTENEDQLNSAIYIFNEHDKISVHNPNSKFIKSVELITILGQSIVTFHVNKNDNYMEYNTAQIETGAYIIKIETENGKQTKKILVK